MSRSILNSYSSAVSVPAALNPVILRRSLALVTVAALAAFAARAEAQTPVQHALQVRPVVLPNARKHVAQQCSTRR